MKGVGEAVIYARVLTARCAQKVVGLLKFRANGLLAMAGLLLAGVVLFDWMGVLREEGGVGPGDDVKGRMVQVGGESFGDEIDYWKQVAEMQPGYIDAYTRLAVYYWRQGEVDQAKEYIEKALKIDPNSVAAQEVSGVVE